MRRNKRPRVLWCAVESGQGGGGGGSSDGKSTPVSVEIDGKQYSVDDVKNIIAQQGESTKASQVAAKALTAAQRYNTDVDTYVQNAEASFALMNDLIGKGIIDESGKIVVKETPKETPKIPGVGGVPLVKADEVAAKALETFHTEFGSLRKEVEKLREDNVGLMRLRLQDKVAEKFKDLDDEDITRVMATAYQSKKPVMEVAKEFSETKKAWLATQEESWAKKHGLDINKLNEDKKFREQSPEGGAGILFQNKKFAFQPKKGDKDTVSPKDAMQEFFNKRSGG